MRITFTLYLIPIIIVSNLPPVTNNKICKFIAGYECAVANYPFIVSIETIIIYRHVCGGSLIRSRWVLSAAHCDKKNDEKYVVVAGLSALMYEEDFITPDYIQESEVLEWYNHPEFIEAFLANDICLLRLKNSIDESPVIKHVALYLEEFPPSFESDCSNSFVLGFGRKDQKYKELIGQKKIARHLKCANLSVIPDNKCMFLPHYTQFCAMDQKTVEECLNPGDSGGPLFCNGKQIGVASGYQLQTRINLFVKVYLYKDFINDVIASSSSKFQLSITCILLEVFILRN